MQAHRKILTAAAAVLAIAMMLPGNVAASQGRDYAPHFSHAKQVAGTWALILPNYGYFNIWWSFYTVRFAWGVGPYQYRLEP